MTRRIVLFIRFGTIRFGTGLKQIWRREHEPDSFGTIRFGTGLKH